MIILCLVLGVVGLFFYWIGCHVIVRSAGSISGVLTGTLMLLLGLALIWVGILAHGFMPTFV